MFVYLQTAATMTMNSPESLLQLHKLVSERKSQEESVYLAELVREIGLKCIGFNGVVIAVGQKTSSVGRRVERTSFLT